MFFEHVSLRKAPFGLGDIQRGAHCSDQGADADHRPEALRGYSGPLHDRSRRLRHTEMELEGKNDTFPTVISFALEKIYSPLPYSSGAERGRDDGGVRAAAVPEGRVLDHQGGRRRTGKC